MLRAASTYVFVNQRLHPGSLDKLVLGGAQAIEIFAAKQHFDYTDRAHVQEVAGWFRDGKATFHSLHAPLHSGGKTGEEGGATVNLIAREKRERIDAMDEIKRAIEVAEILPFQFLVQHLGDPNESFDKHKFDFAQTAIEHLRAFAKPLGVTLLIENIPNEVATPENLVEIVTTGYFNDVGFCFDTGHAHIMSNVEQAFDVMKDRIRSTHVHDNTRDKDSHLWPGSGGIDWKHTMELLCTAPQVPPVLLEINGTDHPDVPKKLNEAWQILGMR